MKRFIIILLLLASPPLMAQEYTIVKRTISSGTGFFVNKLGYIVTNEHVVRNCKDIVVKGSVDPVEANLIAVDKDNDLAVLKVDVPPKEYARLRLDYVLEPGERVMIIGYPKERGVSGEYAIQMASIIDNKGPRGEPEWIQFTDSASQGNSGGPLVDKFGNVIGVVRARVMFYKMDYMPGHQPTKDEIVKKGSLYKSSDIAITTNVLQNFLQRAATPYDTLTSNNYEGEYSLEETASNYIVNVHCYLN